MAQPKLTQEQFIQKAKSIHGNKYDFYGGEKSLTLTQYHDAIKNQYCEDHKIPLIRIPYWDKDKIPEYYRST